MWEGQEGAKGQASLHLTPFTKLCSVQDILNLSRLRYSIRSGSFWNCKTGLEFDYSNDELSHQAENWGSLISKLDKWRNNLNTVSTVKQNPTLDQT